MSLVLDTGTMKYRVNPNQPWRPLVIKANMNWESMADIYDPDNGTYEIGQYVLEDGVMYRCIYPIDTSETWTPAHWTEINIGDELFSLQDSISSEATTRASEDTLIRNTLTQLKTDTFGNINLTGTNTTGTTITAGTFFYNNGSLARAKTDILSGASITIGTNAETVTAGGLNSLNDNLTASSVTVTPNSTYISSTQISCVKNNYIASLSGWFSTNASIPSNGATILSNLPIIPANLYGINMKVLLVNQTTGGVYHCLVDSNGNLKTDYNRQNIPSGEYRIISCMYLLK